MYFNLRIIRNLIRNTNSLFSGDGGFVDVYLEELSAQAVPKGRPHYRHGGEDTCRGKNMASIFAVSLGVNICFFIVTR